MLTTDELIEKLQKEFPKAWFKEGEDFGSGYGAAVWTGEGSCIEKGGHSVPMFDYNNMTERYQFGAHIDLCKFVEDLGYYVECYDSGTFFIYPE